jgi:hypothetical protein
MADMVEALEVAQVARRSLESATTLASRAWCSRIKTKTGACLLSVLCEYTQLPQETWRFAVLRVMI